MAAGKGNRGHGETGRDQALQRQLVRLWTKLVGEREPPALDRWLARELSALDGLPRADRLLLGELLTDGVRFAPLVVLAEAWRQQVRDSGSDPNVLAKSWAEATASPSGGCDAGASAANRSDPNGAPTFAPPTDGPATWRHLRRLAVPAVFFWTFMRKREEGAQLPPIAPPGPEAQAVWRALKTWAPAAHDPAVRALWAGLPPTLAPLLAARAATSAWDEGALRDFLDRHAARPPLWLRLADPRRHAEVVAQLTGQGFLVTAEAGPALAVAGTRGVYELPCHRDGLVDVQDLASQRIGEAVAAAPGQTVWDCCAGAGGKSLQLAAVLEGRGAVHATDLYENKLKDLRKRARRAGWANLRAAVWDGERVPDFGPEVTSRGGFDRVLVDAPCSGSGTWRRHPDGRLRFAADQLPDLAAVQASLLGAAAGAVRPGGLLVYATCSWFTAENEDVVAAFLAAAPAFTLQAQQVHGNPHEDADTTFTAVMRRGAAAQG